MSGISSNVGDLVKKLDTYTTLMPHLFRDWGEETETTVLTALRVLAPEQNRDTLGGETTTSADETTLRVWAVGPSTPSFFGKDHPESRTTQARELWWVADTGVWRFHQAFKTGHADPAVNEGWMAAMDSLANRLMEGLAKA